MTVKVYKNATHHNGHASAPKLLRREKLEQRGTDTVFENAVLRVTALGDPDAPGVFVCFTGTLLAMGGIDAEEFVGSTRLPGFSALFVSDLARSWYNAFAPETFTEAIADRIAGKRVITLGNSMGGYGAIWASKYLPVETVIAFAPQFSMHPEVMPGEKRWRNFRRKIGQWRHRSMEDHFREDVRYYTINGDAPEDREHWTQFPSGANMEHLLVADTGHYPAARFKQAGILSEVIAQCTEGNSPLDVIREGGFEVSRIGDGNA
ncbi:alpha/beta hydrolase [Novosphingobium sp. PC22D]|uniref:alpha/beta hydrolase n=1 Tax=Novosphingobium sp. PC22D TaxID=1962403 RepID=UPI0011458C66|nr:alpha/beta hydrolase [Novosphingobium sp. PC22D]